MEKMPIQIDKLVDVIAQALVDRPDEVEVRMIEGNNTIVLELHVGKGDVGKVIGKRGRTADAIRIIIGAVSSKIRKRTLLEIIDEDQDREFQIPMEPPRSAATQCPSLTSGDSAACCNMGKNRSL